MNYDNSLSSVLREALSSRPLNRLNTVRPSYIEAAVLVPLVVENGEHRVLFTKRSQNVVHHKGQMSFPGGSRDDGDTSMEETALRETFEEIGVPASDIEILGRLDYALTVTSNFVIHPFVGIVPFPYDFIISVAEVESIVNVPLGVFHPANRKSRREVVQIEGRPYAGLAYEYEGDIIWGATASIMENLMDIIGRKLTLPVLEK